MKILPLASDVEVVDFEILKIKLQKVPARDEVKTEKKKKKRKEKKMFFSTYF